MLPPWPFRVAFQALQQMQCCMWVLMSVWKLENYQTRSKQKGCASSSLMTSVNGDNRNLQSIIGEDLDSC